MGKCLVQPPVYYEENNIKDGNNDIFFVKKYGVPEREFILSRYKFIGEFNVGLENTYRSTNPDFSQIPIKQMFWHLRDNLNLTCWFDYKDGQWKVISYIFWPPKAKF